MRDGKVAAILDCYTVAINRGEEQGVRSDMCYALGREVIDPETGESLGVCPHLYVKVTDVYPKFCVAETYKRVSPLERPEVTVNIGDDAQWVK